MVYPIKACDLIVYNQPLIDTAVVIEAVCLLALVCVNFVELVELASVLDLGFSTVV